jgi:hypothetical protein
VTATHFAVMRKTGPAWDRGQDIDGQPEWLAADPWVPMGLLEIASIESWAVLLGQVPDR